MRSSISRLILSLVLAAGLAQATTQPVRADCDAMGHGPNTTVRGSTWVGVFEGATGSGEDTVHHWRVQHVYAGDVPARLTYLPRKIGSSCHPIEFQRGVRYLVSTSDVTSPTNKNTVAHRLLGDGRVRLAPFLVSASIYPSRYRVHTLAAALRVVASGSLPDTDTSAGTTGSGYPESALVIALVGAVLGGLFTLRRLGMCR